MNVQINTQRFTADSKLLDLINEKTEKFNTFHDKIVEVEIFLKLDNIVHQIKDKVVEIKVHIPKHTFFIKHESKTFEESFDHAYKSMVHQLKQYKEKLSA
ncbi:MAG: HPF/RaiA family ribosome-associated protein [Chitinophagaceae bacterium]|nr:HPF/RaiA family ribosome-associated protein [Chitinophagaceae bacterium]